MSELERRSSGKPAPFSKTTLGIGIAIGLAAAFVVNLIIGVILGIAKIAIFGALAIGVAYVVLIGPKRWSGDSK
jgi:membrane associated rhomboid family serine protease